MLSIIRQVATFFYLLTLKTYLILLLFIFIYEILSSHLLIYF